MHRVSPGKLKEARQGALPSPPAWLGGGGLPRRAPHSVHGFRSPAGPGSDLPWAVAHACLYPLEDLSALKVSQGPVEVQAGALLLMIKVEPWIAEFSLSTCWVAEEKSRRAGPRHSSAASQ